MQKLIVACVGVAHLKRQNCPSPFATTRSERSFVHAAPSSLRVRCQLGINLSLKRAPIRLRFWSKLKHFCPLCIRQPLFCLRRHSWLCNLQLRDGCCDKGESRRVGRLSCYVSLCLDTAVTNTCKVHSGDDSAEGGTAMHAKICDTHAASHRAPCLRVCGGVNRNVRVHVCFKFLLSQT